MNHKLICNHESLQLCAMRKVLYLKHLQQNCHVLPTYYFILPFSRSWGNILILQLSHKMLQLVTAIPAKQICILRGYFHCSFVKFWSWHRWNKFSVNFLWVSFILLFSIIITRYCAYGLYYLTYIVTLCYCVQNHNITKDYYYLNDMNILNTFLSYDNSILQQ